MKFKSLKDLMEANYPEVRDDDYKAFHKKWGELFPFVEYGIKTSGYNVGTNQVAVQIMFNQNLSFKKQVAKIKKVLPYIKPSVNERVRANDIPNGSIVLHIFEESCAEYGIWMLCQYPDKVWHLIKYSWGIRSDKVETLDELLKVIYSDLPYERIKPREVTYD